MAHWVETLTRQTIERKTRDLSASLAELVRSGDLTDAEANQWMVEKQEQWAGGDA